MKYAWIVTLWSCQIITMGSLRDIDLATVDLNKLDIGTLHDLVRMYANLIDEDGKTPLHHAALSGESHIMKVLIDHGTDLEIKDRHGRRFSYYARHNIKFGSIGAVLKQLLRKKKNQPSSINRGHWATATWHEAS